MILADEPAHETLALQAGPDNSGKKPSAHASAQTVKSSFLLRWQLKRCRRRRRISQLPLHEYCRHKLYVIVGRAEGRLPPSEGAWLQVLSNAIRLLPHLPKPQRSDDRAHATIALLCEGGMNDWDAECNRHAWEHLTKFLPVLSGDWEERTGCIMFQIDRSRQGRSS